jgi:hypothetical protein
LTAGSLDEQVSLLGSLLCRQRWQTHKEQGKWLVEFQAK